LAYAFLIRGGRSIRDRDFDAGTLRLCKNNGLTVRLGHAQPDGHEDRQRRKAAGA
jgi:hypothetical protein